MNYEKHLIKANNLWQLLLSSENLTVFKSPPTHQGSFQSPLMALNSSQKSSLSSTKIGPYTQVNIQTKLSSQFLKRQETKKAPKSISISSKTDCPKKLRYLLLDL